MVPLTNADPEDLTLWDLFEELRTIAEAYVPPPIVEAWRPAWREGGRQ